jgi:hypothetical protein
MKNFFKSVLFILLLFGFSNTKAQVPILNSYPSSSAVIFLDFDGHTVANTAWNIDSAFVCAGSGLSTAQITEVFNRVAEDYRTFSLNITTDSTKYWAAPFDKRQRVIITVSNGWYGSGAGGVAYVGTFGDIDNTPCFVFSALLNYNSKKVSEAVSHEAGHTLWLYHQSLYDANCVKLSDYHSGQGTGEIGWAPIMGIGYSRNMTVWNLGPNSYGCGVIQSDIKVILLNTGLTLRTDDYTSTFAGATNLPFNNNEFLASGFITRTTVGDSTDQDMFKFTTAVTGRFRLNAVPFSVGSGNDGSDLDMQVTLYNSGQTQLNVYNPGTLLSSVIDTTLNAGTYYLKIEGKGNQYAPGYGSMGAYSLQGLTGLAALPLRRLELKGSLNNDLHQLNWLIDADEQVVRQILEISTDGRNFTTLTDAGAALRNYIYRPNATGAIQYRLNVIFDNDRQYYSNVVTLRKSGNNPKPQLISNFITGSTLEVLSPGTFNYDVYDYNGRTVASGKIINGSNILRHAGFAAAGMYIIRFNDGGSGVWTDKFIRQ